jgi:hypothetical protein
LTVGDSRPFCRSAAAAALAATVVLWTSAAAPHAQNPDLQALLDKATVQIVDFLNKFTNVVVEETYIQETTRLRRKRTLRSDLALVLYPGARQWLFFRDVYEVDGKPVRNEAQQERLTRLFIEPPANARQRAADITQEGARYNLVDIGTVNNPLLAITMLQPDYRTHFRFNLAGQEKGLGPRVRIVRFQEFQRPTILKAGTNNDMPVHGLFWIDESTGRVVKTEIEFGDSRIPPEVVTLFKFDEGLGLSVPAEMRDWYPDGDGDFRGVATYGKFRRFQVRTDATIRP